MTFSCWSVVQLHSANDKSKTSQQFGHNKARCRQTKQYKLIQREKKTENQWTSNVKLRQQQQQKYGQLLFYRTVLTVFNETRKRFRLILSSMSAASAAITKWYFLNISVNIRAGKLHKSVGFEWCSGHYLSIKVSRAIFVVVSGSNGREERIFVYCIRALMILGCLSVFS